MTDDERMEIIKENFYSLGLAHLKVEGARIVYDGDAPPSGPPEPAWRRWLRVGGERLRYLPARVWWAFFGDDYWDSGW